MTDLSEFVSFVAEKSKVKNLRLIEKDIILHKILSEIYASKLGKKYLFKGGSCLVKCYFGYYRFSVDLDFTWADQKTWKGLGKRKLRKKLLNEIEDFGSLIENVSKRIGFEFESELGNKKFMEFGGGARMVTFKLWKDLELIKIQINFVEQLLFQSKIVLAKTLLNKVKLKRDEEAYFEEILQFYKPIKIKAYDEREILCEKVRAILTRKTQKLRDFYDLFLLDKHGFKVEDLKDEIVEKVRFALHYKKYMDALKRNKEQFRISKEVLEDPFERELFISKPTKDFEDYSSKLTKVLKEIVIEV
ncbi:MAG: hypothetical protein DRJ30_03210 [Candidatus Methanomethylicota archaeon]|nr:MAG: hypothetical protein DRJ30_03210 [Candidatus Verstraetearchaeota archaeon]